MRKTLTPDEIVDADDPTLTKTERSLIQFDKFANETALCIAYGCKLLARLWLTAWVEADRPKLPASKPFLQEELIKIYRDRDFGQGLSIDEYADAEFIVIP